MGGLSSPRSLYVSATPFECEQMFILFYFPPLVVLSVGHHSGTVPIRVLQTDIAGRNSGEAGQGIGKMAEGARPYRRPREALPGRRRVWYGIESGGARRLSSGLLYNAVDHGFQKQGDRMIAAGEDAKHSESWNRFPASRSTVVMANRRLFFFFVSNTFGQSQILIPLDYIPFTYNICNSFRFGVRSRCSLPMPIMTHPLMVVNS